LHIICKVIAQKKRGSGWGMSFAQQGTRSESTKPVPDGQVEEISVTGERRSERLQDVPIAVSVPTADEAQKMGDHDNLSLFTQVPSSNTSRQLTGATIYLRGDTSVTWTVPSNKYDVQLWCKNCTDKYHDAFISEAALAIQRAASDPPTFGIQFGVHF
jgi:outer membrane receptor protein involved in Fe transport